MSESLRPEDVSHDSAALPEELPPVEPPSAGFIVQLFLVPALIVMVVVGVWALFGKMASSEQDWRKLVAEVQSGNHHRRWRGALGLAQMLKADEQLGSNGTGLTRNSEIAGELTALLREQLGQRATQEDDIKQQAFLARTLGFLDVPETVLPALQEAMQPEHDLDIRRNAIASVALIAGRAVEAGRPLDAPELVDDLIAATLAAEPPLRHLGTYALGLIPCDASRQRLLVLAQSGTGDRPTQVNAAVGLARQKSTAGLPLFKTIVTEAATASDPEPTDLIILGNTLRALDGLADEVTAQERLELAELVQPIARSHRDRRLRLDAEKVLLRLNSN